MSAEVSRSNGYVSLTPAVQAILIRWRRFRRNRLIALDGRLDQEGLSAHMARDVGLNDASLTYGRCRSYCDF